MVQNRVKRLEGVIEDLVSYLERLPANPETYRRAAAARAVIEKDPDPVPLVGVAYTPAGVALAGAQVFGDRVTLYTQNVDHMPPSFQLEHKVNLYRELADGLQITLREQASMSWANQFGPSPVPEPTDPTYAMSLKTLGFLVEAARGGEVHQGNCIPPLQGVALNDYLEGHFAQGGQEMDLCPICLALEEVAAATRQQDLYSGRGL